MNCRRSRVLRTLVAAAIGFIFGVGLAELLAGCVFCLPALGQQTPGTDMVKYVIDNFGTRQKDVVVTFGSIFAAGDLPRGAGLEAVSSDGQVLSIQLDRKATYPDGSLRHGVVTLVIPRFSAGGEMAAELRRTDGAKAGDDKSIQLSDLPPGFDVTVVAREGEHRFTSSVRGLLDGRTVESWLQGPYVSEWWVTGSFKDAAGQVDPHLSVRYGIRCYGKGKPVRIDVVVENDWTFVHHPRTDAYDAEIRLGNKLVFTKSGIVQASQTRWRKGFWWDEPVAVYVKQNLDYLEKARVVPSYDPGLQVSRAALSKLYDEFETSDRGPMGTGLITAYMPTTGGRADIAPLPRWQALYLLTMDPRAYEMTLQSGDLGASFPCHYRNEKTGRLTTVEDFPNISAIGALRGTPGQPEKPETLADEHPPVPDSAHEPSLDFLPYLITGDRFYLEELQFWSMWNAMDTGPQYRGYAAGLLNSDQIRGQAWSLRTLAQAEYVTPDGDPLKPVLRRQLAANLAWYNAHYVTNPAANHLGLLERQQPYDNGRSMAPWQDDYFTWSVGYVWGLGHEEALPLLRWKARFSVGRMIAPGFCWILGSSYTLRVRDRADAAVYPDFASVYEATLPQKMIKQTAAKNLDCASEEMADALGLKVPGEMFQNGYTAFLQPALAAAVDSGIDGAESAWRVFESRALKLDYSSEPEWDIVPWSWNRPAK